MSAQITERGDDLPHRFTQEATRLLDRSSGYIAVARVRAGSLTEWIEAPQHSVSPAHQAELKGSVESALGSIKLLTQTIPERDDKSNAVTLQIEFEGVNTGMIHLYGQALDYILLVTDINDLTERARFWVKHYGARVILDKR